MSTAQTVHRRVMTLIAASCAHEDPRRVRTAAWLVTGLLLKQDARLPRLALAMASPRTHAPRVRRLRRWLDGPFDVHGCYGDLVARTISRWWVDEVTLVLDTTSVGGRLYFVRIGAVHDEHTIPVAWRVVVGKSATVDFESYRCLLEAAERILPRRMTRTLVADGGFQHVRLFRWCDRHGWRYRVRAKSSLTVVLPDGTQRAVREFRSRVGEMRAMETVFVTRYQYGPAGLVLAWPRYGSDPTMHVLSSDAPSVRTLWDFSRLSCVDRGFRGDKSACFGIERTRLTSRVRLERLLFGLAVAELILKALATRSALRDDAWQVDADSRGGLSLLQTGARLLRRSVWNGRTPPLHLDLLPDYVDRGSVAEARTLRRFYRRLGLEPGKRWIPSGSFEERTLMWWLPGPTKRYPPRMPLGKPPLL